MEQAVVVTLFLFLAGIVFQMGRYSMRIEKLEEWRTEQREQHAENLSRFDRLERALLRGASEAGV